MRDDYINSAFTRDAYGTEMKKYALCTLISSFITLLLGAALQFVWFKYDDIIRNNWLRISSKSYTSDELPWIRFCQNSLVSKIIPILSIVVILILAVYMVYDIWRDVWNEGAEENCTKPTLFVAKGVAIALFSLIMTAFLALADFFAQGCLTYDNGTVWLLDERHFVPTTSYAYYEVWSKHPHLNVMRYIQLFALILLFFVCVHFFVSIGKLLSKHTSDVVSIVAAIALMVIAGGVVVATRASIIAIAIMVVVLAVANYFFQNYLENASKK